MVLPSSILHDNYIYSAAEPQDRTNLLPKSKGGHHPFLDPALKQHCTETDIDSFTTYRETLINKTMNSGILCKCTRVYIRPLKINY